MDDYKHLCPVCKNNGKTMFLQLRQINFNTATYLCKDIRCTYPLGHSWIFVDKDIFNEDESDSDSSNVSDEVNADIERFLMTTQNSNEINVTKCLNNNNNTSGKMNMTVKADSNIKYVRDSHNLDRSKYSTSQQLATTKNTCDLPTKTKNSKEVNVSKLLNNYASDKINFDLNVNKEAEVINDRDKHKLACDKFSTSEQSARNYDDDVIMLDSDNNVIIEIPDELIGTLDLPSLSSTADFQPKVLASGASNSEIVDINVLKDTNPVATNIQYHLVKNDEEPNKFNIDIGMITRKEDISKLNVTKSGTDNADVQHALVKSNKEQSKSNLDIDMAEQKKDIELNIAKSVSTDADMESNLVKSVKLNTLELGQKKNIKSINSPNKKNGEAIIDIRQIQKNTKKGICVIDLKSGKLKGTGVNLLNSKNTNKINIIKVPFDISKVINVSRTINAEQNTISKINDLSGSKGKNENISPTKSINMDLENILMEDNIKNNTVETENKANNLEEKSIKVNTMSKEKNNSLGITLPFIGDINPDLELKMSKSKVETVFKSKLKLQPKKSKRSSFYLSESIVEEALQAARSSKNTEPPKNRSLVSLLFEPNNSNVSDKNSASAFKGFKFSSEIIKPAMSDLPQKKKVKEKPSKCVVENVQPSPKDKKINKKLRDKNVEQIQSECETEIVNADANTSVSSKSGNKDNTNLGLGDLTLNELFDNIDSLGAVNVPNNSVDIAEVDEWLTSLCD